MKFILIINMNVGTLRNMDSVMTVMNNYLNQAAYSKYRDTHYCFYHKNPKYINLIPIPHKFGKNKTICIRIYN